VSLAEARDAASALRRQVREGADPVAERRKARKVVPSFETAARNCYEALKSIADTAALRRDNHEAIDACEQQAAKAKQPVRCTIRMRYRQP